MDVSEVIKAVIQDDRVAVDNLIAEGWDVNSGLDGSTALIEAVTAGHTDMAVQLLDGGADINQGSDKVVSPLCAAAAINRLDLAELLLTRGCDIKRLNDQRPLHQIATPLHFAILQGNDRMVKLLLDYGHNPNVPSHYSQYPIIEAIKHNFSGCVQLLLNCPRCLVDAAHDSYGGWDYPPLYQSLFRYRRYDIAKAILASKRCKLSFRSDSYLSMVMWKICDNSYLHLRICKMLLESGADMCCTDSHGDRPITTMVRCNDKVLNLTAQSSAIRILILAGIKPSKEESDMLQTYVESEPEQELVSWVRFSSLNPGSLAIQCRAFIRSFLGLFPVESLLKLPLPQPLTDFVTLHDLRNIY